MGESSTTGPVKNAAEPAEHALSSSEHHDEIDPASTRQNATDKSRASSGRHHFHFHLPPEARLPSYSSFLSKRRRQKTALDDIPIEGRPFPHKYAIRRPRALQYKYHGKVYEGGDSGRTDLHVLAQEKSSQDPNDISRETSSEQASTFSQENRQERTTDNIDTQRERLDLFTDLLWVGIISNISEHYYEQSFAPEASIGKAVVEFLVLFLPAWSIWVVLQIFLSSFFMDDILQRILILWILMLGLIFGNNAPFFLNITEEPNPLVLALQSIFFGDEVPSNEYNPSIANNLIYTYIVAKNTIHLVEVAYSFFIPWLRRRNVFGFLFMLPSTGLWVAATLVEDAWTKVYILIGGIVWEYWARSILASPLEARLLKSDITKARNEKHIIKRYESFFIIALGEGVFLLIRGSPAGRGFHEQLGRTVLTLLLYYGLHWLYFNGDQTKTFVHALYRRWYLGVLWGLFHITLFSNLVLLSSGMLYLIDYTPDEGETNGVPEAVVSRFKRRAESGQTGQEAEAAGEGKAKVSTSHATLRTATVSTCVNLAIILFSTTVLSLLNRPLDKPKTLIINNRYLRLLPRMCAVVVCATVWLHDFENPTYVIGTLTLIVAVVFQWEWHAGLETGGKFFEPKDSWKES